MSDKLTDTQYAALRTFACNPYLTEWGSWYSATHIAMASDTMRKQTMNWLRSQGYIERANIEFHSYFVITPAGIAAHDARAAARCDHDFAQAQREYAAQREKADAARDAKRIVVASNLMYQVSNPDLSVQVLDHVMALHNGDMCVSFRADELDTVIALLTEAKRELARRTEAR